MGFGDVKLAGLVGAMLGWLSWSALLVGAFAAFVLGGVVGIAVIASRRGNGKTPLPFGPFMLAGAALALYFAQPVADAYLRLSGILTATLAAGVLRATPGRPSTAAAARAKGPARQLPDRAACLSCGRTTSLLDVHRQRRAGRTRGGSRRRPG